MNRPLAFVFALLLAILTVSSACLAQPAALVHFMLEPEGGSSTKIQASFRDHSRDADKTNWSTGFMPSDLIGLEVSSFRSPGTRPLHFSIVCEAGRLDCAGNGGNNYAAGNCRFTQNPAFSEFLAARGIGRPTRDQAFGLMAVNAKRDLVDAVAAARYPMPTIDNLMALSALSVDRPYIAGMAHSGYRPASIQKLIEFKAVGITPEWIGGFARVGYANVPADELVQMRALGITSEYIAGFQRIGYRDLPVNTLVELKALDITPEFVRSAVGQQAALPPVSELVRTKMFGRRR
jgi:hypothetical protein